MIILNYLKLLTLFINKQTEINVNKILINNKKTLSVAESCTGGLISSLLTDLSGSSAYIKANFVTYANEAKTKYLNVKKETLDLYGAVSKETAEEMIKGLLNATDSDYALATTGIAGPTGGTKEKPVGLVYIGIGSKQKIKIIKYNTNHKYPRQLIKYLFAKKAIKELHQFIKGN